MIYGQLYYEARTARKFGTPAWALHLLSCVVESDRQISYGWSYLPGDLLQSIVELALRAEDLGPGNPKVKHLVAAIVRLGWQYGRDTSRWESVVPCFEALFQSFVEGSLEFELECDRELWGLSEGVAVYIWRLPVGVFS